MSLDRSKLTGAGPAGPAGAAGGSQFDTPPASPTTQDDEFDGTTTLDAKWTEVLTGTTTRNQDTTWDSHYYLTGDGSGIQGVSLWEAWVPGASTATSLTAKMRVPFLLAADEVGIYLTDTSGFTSNYVGLIVHGDGTVRLRKKVAGSATNIAGPTAYNPLTTVYLHLQRTSADVWTGWYSGEAYAWRRIGTGTQAITVGRIYLDWYNSVASQPFRAGIDWVRRDFLTL